MPGLLPSQETCFLRQQSPIINTFIGNLFWYGHCSPAKLLNLCKRDHRGANGMAGAAHWAQPSLCSSALRPQCSRSWVSQGHGGSPVTPLLPVPCVSQWSREPRGLGKLCLAGSVQEMMWLVLSCCLRCAEPSQPQYLAMKGGSFIPQKNGSSQ